MDRRQQMGDRRWEMGDPALSHNLDLNLNPVLGLQGFVFPMRSRTLVSGGCP